MLARGEEGSFDERVVGDPCVVWDDEIRAWRMFYFGAARGDVCATGMAVNTSKEEIGPGNWHKAGKVALKNPECLVNQKGWHKWWVIMDAGAPNYAARINGRYHALFASTMPDKRVQTASAERLSGPWTVDREPILSPGEGYAPDSLYCDTPSGFYFGKERTVYVFYKGYPKLPQAEQPGSPFGSCQMLALWRPGEKAVKIGAVLRPSGWASGWIGGLQLLGNGNVWRALINGSPTPPEDVSHREPAPSLGGFARCAGDIPDKGFVIAPGTCPIKRAEDLTEGERSAGLGFNFWRHHLLITPGGRMRIFINSGGYGMEQLYSYEVIGG